MAVDKRIWDWGGKKPEPGVDRLEPEPGVDRLVPKLPGGSVGEWKVPKPPGAFGPFPTDVPGIEKRLASGKDIDEVTDGVPPAIPIQLARLAELRAKGDVTSRQYMEHAYKIESQQPGGGKGIDEHIMGEPPTVPTGGFMDRFDWSRPEHPTSPALPANGDEPSPEFRVLTATHLSTGAPIPSDYTGDPREWGLEVNLVNSVKDMVARGEASGKDLNTANELVEKWKGNVTSENRQQFWDEYTSFWDSMLQKQMDYAGIEGVYNKDKNRIEFVPVGSTSLPIPPPGEDEDLVEWLRALIVSPENYAVTVLDVTKLEHLYQDILDGKATEDDVRAWVDEILGRGMDIPDTPDDVLDEMSPVDRLGWGWGSHPWSRGTAAPPPSTVAPQLLGWPQNSQKVPLLSTSQGGGSSPIEQLMRGEGRGKGRRFPVDPRIVERIQKSAVMRGEQSGFMDKWGGPEAYKKLVKLPQGDRLVYFAVLEGYSTPEEIEPIIDLPTNMIERSLSKLIGLGLIRGS